MCKRGCSCVSESAIDAGKADGKINFSYRFGRMIQSVLGEERDGEQAEQKRCMHETLGDKRDIESLSRSLYAKAKIL